MTGAFYGNLAKTGKRLLSQYGKDLVITRVVNGSYDPVTSAVASTTTTHTVKGQVFDYTDSRIATSGGLVVAGDRRVIISAVDISFEPNPSTDSVTIGSTKWSIVRVSKPVDEDVIYDMQVRRV